MSDLVDKLIIPNLHKLWRIQNSKTTLFIGCMVVLTSTIKIDWPDYIRNADLLSPLFLLIWVYIWLERRQFPKSKEGTLSIILCIGLEDGKSYKFRKDLIAHLKQVIRDKGLNMEILVIPEYQEDRLISLLDDLPASSQNQKKCPQLKMWNRVQQQIKGAFYIWGEIKERTNQTETYVLDAKGLVTHGLSDTSRVTELQKVFNDTWKSMFLVNKNNELLGFTLTAESISCLSLIIIGTAAHLSGDPICAYQLHSSLENTVIPADIQKQINSHLPRKLAEECYDIGRLYYRNGLLSEAMIYIDKCLQYRRNLYQATLLKAILLFKMGDPAESLALIKYAKNQAGVDLTWRYNNAFLLMYFGRYSEAMKHYNRAMNAHFENEDNVLSEIKGFIIQYMSENQKFIEGHFINGLIFFKLKEFSNSRDSFEQFLITSKDNPKYAVLRNHATPYYNKLRKLE